MGALETIGLATLAFAATNVDDFFLLLAFFADGRSRPRQIVFGQYLGFGAIVFLSLLVAWGANFLPQRWIDLLGIVPLLIGIKELFDLRKPADADDRQQSLDTTLVSRRSILAIAGVTIANGADNVGAYVPLFALQQENDALIILTFYCLVAVWCVVAYRLVKLGRTAVRHERALTFVKPIVLIVFGIWMLLKFAKSI